MWTEGLPHRTTSLQHVGWSNHQQLSVSSQSATTSGLFCLCFCLIKLRTQPEQTRPEQASHPFSWFPDWQVTSRAPIALRKICYVDTVPEKCTLCQDFRSLKMKNLPLVQNWSIKTGDRRGYLTLKKLIHIHKSDMLDQINHSTKQ